eukprot:CAMPEP_0181189640 /NCGR_PEP_ID=MMETSP1096-20121128/11768_1 /TAXON_ID=156174 ORGANISM="Chrysochromulina ericina, Strain CCMP281" /NCGR_SAMPLE_ID=MMETSP1096 /ASSEMBLY_ACC=CAM_ASM_000453 /LENGTH=74 /DNA_ID=CAMNT_0023278803 /DNA_START=527 /DNA_END=748 /DNA_ORIENTATION=-
MTCEDVRIVWKGSAAVDVRDDHADIISRASQVCLVSKQGSGCLGIRPRLGSDQRAELLRLNEIPQAIRGQNKIV